MSGEPQAMTLEEAMLYVNRHGARLVHSDTYGGAWEGKRCWYVVDLHGNRASLVCRSWIEALASFQPHPTLPVGTHDDAAELIEARDDAAELRAAAEEALEAIGRQQRDPAYHSAYLLLQRAARRLRAALAKWKAQN